MDSFAANREFGTQLGVEFPLLSDWKREVTKAYGIYNEESGYGTRATFVVDKEGKIQHVEVGRSAIDPSGAYQACDILSRPRSRPQEPEAKKP